MPRPSLRLLGLTLSLACACTRESSDATPAAQDKTAEDLAPVPDPKTDPRTDPKTDPKTAAELVRDDGTIFAEAEMMGTRVSINLWLGPSGDALAAQEAITEAMHEMARIEDIASEWRPTSDLSKVNAAEGEAVTVAPELVEILQRAAEVSAATNGLFDVSFYAVGQLWRFEPGAQPPPEAEIEARLPGVDWRSIELDPGARTVHLTKPGMKVGLGAIAKGYAVDRAAAVLRERGFANHIVEAGGDTQVSGQKGDKPWRVGIQDPERSAGRIGHIVAKDEAVVTSGNYARYFEWQGVHYTHILDPRTGWPIPADRSPKSVTLVAGNATDADAYCTAVSVMRPEQGVEFVEARAGLEAIIIGPDDTLYVTSGLRDRFVDEREPDAD